MKPHAAGYLLSLVLSLLAAGCGVDPSSTSGSSVRDSAGIRIVEYEAEPEIAGPFVFSSRPLYRYGAELDDYGFRRISAGVLLPGGGAAVADAANREIVIVEPDGSFGGRLAGPGDGPGEIGMVRTLLATGGDTLLLEDAGHSRLTLFAGGVAVREVDMRFLNRGLMLRGLDGSGRALLTSGRYMPDFPEPWLQGHMVRFDMDAGAVDTVASYDWVPSSPREGPSNPFGPAGLVTVARGRFVSTRSDTPEVIWRNSDGTVLQVLRWRPEPAYPDDEDWGRYVTTLRANLRLANPQIQSDEEFAEAMARVLARYEMAPNEPLPLVSQFFGDREGRLWLGEWTAGASLRGSAGYSVLAPDGRWLGHVAAPPRVRILDVAGGRVLGVFRDELGVESVVAYELLPAPVTGEPAPP